MTRLTTISHGLVRETSTLYRGRPLVVTLAGQYMRIHPKGLPSHCYTIRYDQVYEAAGKIMARMAAPKKGRN